MRETSFAIGSTEIPHPIKSKTMTPVLMVGIFTKYSHTSGSENIAEEGVNRLENKMPRVFAVRLCCFLMPKATPINSYQHDSINMNQTRTRTIAKMR